MSKLPEGVPTCPIKVEHYFTYDKRYVAAGGACGRPAVHVCPVFECNGTFCSTHVTSHACIGNRS